VLQAGRNKTAAAARADSGDVTVHVHDTGGDGFNRTKKLRRQASPDDDGDGKDAHENNFPAARGARRAAILVSRFSRHHAMTKSSPGVNRINCASH
jgi:hypothetical protein